MAKYRGRTIAGVSIVNPRRDMKKVTRAQTYTSLHCSNGLKDESMKIPRSFADFTVSTDSPSANGRGAVGRGQRKVAALFRIKRKVPFHRPTRSCAKAQLRVVTLRTWESYLFVVREQ